MWWMWEQTRELLESIRYIWVTLSWGFTYVLIKRQWFYGFQLQNRIGESEQLWKLLSSIRNLWEFWNSYSLLINHTQKSCTKEIWVNVVSNTQKLGSSRTQPASAIWISVKVVAHCTIVFDYEITRQAPTWHIQLSICRLYVFQRWVQIWLDFHWAKPDLFRKGHLLLDL